MSPRELRENWLGWAREVEAARAGQRPVAVVDVIDGIDRIYPMTAGRCLGRQPWPQDDGTVRFTYAYGPCRNLDERVIDGRVMPACAIHETRPAMCSGYPIYKKAPTENPGMYRGCGYNADPNAGSTEAEFRAQLLPLSPEEL